MINYKAIKQFFKIDLNKKKTNDKSEVDKIQPKYPFSCSDETGIRRSGQSTRLADKYIQDLFEGKEVRISDHHWALDEDNTSTLSQAHKRASKFLVNIILRRLLSEHNLDNHSNPKVVVNKDKLTIKIVQINKDDKN